MKIDIVGAGIGGLTTAIALESVGVKYSIFEQSKEIKPVGAGIILANNAMQVYAKLGLKEEIEAAGNYISSVNITKPNLTNLSVQKLIPFEQKYGAKNIAIHRGILQQILVNKLKHTQIHLDHELDKIDQNSNGYSLSFLNNQKHHSTTLIGADGINSVVRNTFFPNNQIRDAHQTCWRGVTNYQLPQKYQNGLYEAWGNQSRFGMVQIAKNKVYWYALQSTSENNNTSSIFESYHPIIIELINNTPTNHVYKSKICDLKPTKKWHLDNLCLIGDAAHATTPNMGQGACQAIEDAYVIAKLLAKNNPKEAFTAFQKIRLPKAHLIVNGSWNLGKIAHLSNPFLRGIRNQAMKLTPAFISQNQTDKIFKIPVL